MRHWLLTSTTYGTWLPGDARGSVTSVRDYRTTDGDRRVRVEHDRHGELWEAPIPKLAQCATAQMARSAVWLNAQHASLVTESFVATAAYRGWTLHASSVMANHFHVVASAPPDVRAEKLLRDFKAYASRALNQHAGSQGADLWWTRSGSRRPLWDVRALDRAVNYVLNQQKPLCVWNQPPENV
ncbi:Transposase IS200 like protein [Botrimarina colliarenosi]|uniref:Transposase IS200 like protein n=1 Tax=Botrimarina colliarenosi TaxID=2528001 RepID=A0A5C6A3B2_9BACT|nr:transposase [Botrimarina colliarenosi]TWT94029.1 Transposase IS200 like protein [Botrimarina colliarenosi]